MLFSLVLAYLQLGFKIDAGWRISMSLCPSPEIYPQASVF